MLSERKVPGCEWDRDAVTSREMRNFSDAAGGEFCNWDGKEDG